ncbi:MAG: hypothetical protein AB1640_16005 [bacterium]
MPSWLGQDLEAIRRLMQSELPAPLHPFMQGLGYDLPGRHDFPLRPFLLLSAARHYGRSGDRPIRLGAAVQMIHVASLLHDRLGQTPPAPGPADDPNGAAAGHRRESTDILLGDYLFAKASQVVVRDGDECIIRDMIRTSAESAEAKARIVGLDEPALGLGPRHCFEACAEKLSLLLSLSLRTGALLGETVPEEVRALSEYGRLLGRTLRIFDDLRFWKQPEEADSCPAAERALAHPLIVLWEEEGREAWEGARRELSRPERTAFESLRERLLRGGWLEASAREAGREAASAAERLADLAPTPERNLLQELARRIGESAVWRCLE